MEAVAGPGAATGAAIASLGRRGRGDVDADSMGYDEVKFWQGIPKCAPIVPFSPHSNRQDYLELIDAP